METFIKGLDGTAISVRAFDNMTYDEQHDWLEIHSVPLAVCGDLVRFAQGIPGIYSHLCRFLTTN